MGVPVRNADRDAFGTRVRAASSVQGDNLEKPTDRSVGGLFRLPLVEISFSRFS